MLSKTQQHRVSELCRHVLAADEVRRNQRERLQSPGHEPTQRDDHETSTTTKPASWCHEWCGRAVTSISGNGCRSPIYSGWAARCVGSSPSWTVIPRPSNASWIGTDFLRAVPAADRRPRRTAATGPPAGPQADRQPQAAAVVQRKLNRCWSGRLGHCVSLMAEHYDGYALSRPTTTGARLGSELRQDGAFL